MIYWFFTDETIRSKIVGDTEEVARTMFGVTDPTIIAAMFKIRDVSGIPSPDDGGAFTTLGTGVSNELAEKLQTMSSDVVW